MAWAQFEAEFPMMAAAMKFAKKNNTFAHAFLIYADHAETRRYAPVALAQLRLCLDPAPDATPCGKCAHCLALEHGTYAEFFSLAPISKSRQIRIGADRYEPDTMRWFESQFYFTSDLINGVKVGVINDAECLNEQAQNAFLKTLEEPPAQSFFMLVTSAPYQLLPTIRSRCQMVTLLSNRCTYNYSFVTPLLSALKSLAVLRSDAFADAEMIAGEILALVQQLKGEAETLEAPNWTALYDEMKQTEWSAAERKVVEARRDASVQARYLGLRVGFLNLILDYFSLAWQRSIAVPQSPANPEIQAQLPLIDMHDEPLWRKRLQCAEKLLSDLKYNINEELAFRVFVHDVASAR